MAVPDSAPALVRNLGLELPVFDESQYVEGHLDRIRIPHWPSFVRQVLLSGEAESLRLSTVLDRAAANFEMIGRLCNAEIVAHTWGLLPDTGKIYQAIIQTSLVIN